MTVAEWDMYQECLGITCFGFWYFLSFGDSKGHIMPITLNEITIDLPMLPQQHT